MLLSPDETKYSEWYSIGRTALLAVDSDFTAAGGTGDSRTFGENGDWVLRDDCATASVYYVDSNGQYIDIKHGGFTIFAVRPSIYMDSTKGCLPLLPPEEKRRSG